MDTPSKYAKRWLVAAFGPAWAWYEKAGTPLGILALVLPKISERWPGYLPKWVAVGDSVMWAGLAMFGTMLLGRLLTAPYRLHAEDSETLSLALRQGATDPRARFGLKAQVTDALIQGGGVRAHLFVLNLSETETVSLTFAALPEGRRGQWKHWRTLDKDLPTHVRLGPHEQAAGNLYLRRPEDDMKPLEPCSVALEITDHISGRVLQMMEIPGERSWEGGGIADNLDFYFDARDPMCNTQLPNDGHQMIERRLFRVGVINRGPSYIDEAAVSLGGSEPVVEPPLFGYSLYAYPNQQDVFPIPRSVGVKPATWVEVAETYVLLNDHLWTRFRVAPWLDEHRVEQGALIDSICPLTLILRLVLQGGTLECRLLIDLVERSCRASFVGAVASSSSGNADA